MNLTEIEIYAVETRAIIHVLWGLFIIALCAITWLGMDSYGLRKKLRGSRGREGVLNKEISKLNLKLKHYDELQSGTEHLKMEMRRYDAIRSKAEKRLTEQNIELADAKEDAMQLRSILAIMDIPVEARLRELAATKAQPRQVYPSPVAPRTGTSTKPR